MKAPISSYLAKHIRDAAATGNLASLKRLAGQCAPEDLRNPDPDTGATTLMVACKNGHVRVVGWLIEHDHEGNGISTDFDYNTPLIVATRARKYEVVRYLVKRCNVSLNKPNQLKTTALMYAAKEGYSDIVRLLLSYGATTEQCDDDGNTALHHAAAWGHKKSVAC